MLDFYISKVSERTAPSTAIFAADRPCRKRLRERVDSSVCSRERPYFKFVAPSRRRSRAFRLEDGRAHPQSIDVAQVSIAIALASQECL